MKGANWRSWPIDVVDGERIYTKEWVVVNMNGSWPRVLCHCADAYAAELIVRALNERDLHA